MKDYTMRWIVLAIGLSAATSLHAADRLLGPDLPGTPPLMRPAAPEVETPGPDTARPNARNNRLPRARWEQRRNGDLWTRVALAAAKANGLVDVVPEDITAWCPAYPNQTPENRAAFWAALISAVARYESTWNERAISPNGRWHGLMQIQPSTAEFRGCRAQTGQALRVGTANVSCAARIMSVTVPRDNAISLKGDRRWRGVAADWGPIRATSKRRNMQRYTQRQTYCRLLADVRPKQRPG
ncbi:MAG: transglycosylase SLT domain-containing protein [Pseudomonadota bacterium]